MDKPAGVVSLDELLRYIESDRYLSLQEAAAYLSMKPRMLREILPPQLRFRVSSKKILVRKSELDEFMNRFREQPQKDLTRIVDDAVEAVFRK